LAAHLPVAFVKPFQVSSVLDCISHVPISRQSKWPHLEMASCWTLSEHPPCSHIWHTCQPGYTPQRHGPHTHFEFIYPWAHLPASSAHKLAHALSTRTKVHLSGVVPFCCISWKSSTVFSCCPTLAYLASLLFHEKMSNCTVPGAMETSFDATHGGFCGSSSQSSSCVF